MASATPSEEIRDAAQKLEDMCRILKQIPTKFGEVVEDDFRIPPELKDDIKESIDDYRHIRNLWSEIYDKRQKDVNLEYLKENSESFLNEWKDELQNIEKRLDHFFEKLFNDLITAVERLIEAADEHFDKKEREKDEEIDQRKTRLDLDIRQRGPRTIKSST